MPLLSFLAKDHADAVAELWPAPHEGFLTLPTQRRHAAALLLAGLGAETIKDKKRLRARIERDRDGDIAALLMGDRAPGLMKLLAKLGEQLWAVDDYQSLLTLFSEPNANRVLRHLPRVLPSSFAPINALPSQLREANILAHVGGLQAARDLATAFRLALRMRGDRAATRIISRWNTARNRERLFAMAIDDLCPDVFRPPMPAPDLPAPFERIKTRKALQDLALEFRNCLRDYTDDVARGRMAVFAWRGSEPAALALIWDAAGWRLAEAEAPDNQELSESTLREIVSPITECGVRTGLSMSAISNRLEAHKRGDTCQARDESFMESLALGDLWN